MNDLQTQPVTAAQAPRIITVNLPPKEDMETRASALLAAADGLLIDSECMAEIAAEELISVKAAYKKLEELRVFHVSPLNSEVKYINDHFRDALAKMDQAEGSYKRKMLDYQNAQEQKRKEEQARLEAEQRVERARIAAENAEREKRAQAEAAAKLLEQAQAMERERQAREEIARRQSELEEAIKAGDRKKAEEATRLQMEAEAIATKQKAVADQAQQDAAATVAAATEQAAANETAMMVMTAPVAAPAAKLKGISSKKAYKGKVIDKLALVKYIAAHPEYLNLVEANDTAINQLAKAQGMALTVDGISVYEAQTLAARRA